MGERKCPSCGNKMSGRVLYRCDNCLDIRCTSQKCTGSMGGRQKGFGVNGGLCKSCKKGHYQMIYV